MLCGAMLVCSKCARGKGQRKVNLQSGESAGPQSDRKSLAREDRLLLQWSLSSDRDLTILSVLL